jgi:cobalt-zinc-cadmium resistance protein CzcA
LIFILLHSAFSDIRLAALVFSVIPFSVVGGMLTLLLFGIPFSTSAGIGFVILFGISTLNGIVLIENYDILKKTSRLDLSMLVIKGSRQKLRPVLMITAGFMFGFFPILLLGGTGIEIQRPLAIVVIGGIFVGTLYTLFVLPVLYTLMERHLRNGYRYMPDWLP